MDDPKTIEGKARVRQKYDRLFYWYIPLMACFAVVIALAAVDWNLKGLVMLFPGVGFGVVIGVLLRDVP